MSYLTARLFNLTFGGILILLGTLFAQTQSISRQGAHCIFVQRDNQITAIRIYFRGGFISDPAGKEGLNALLLEMLLRTGTQQLDSSRFRMQLDSLYVHMRWEIQPDYAAIEIEVPSQNTATACQLLSQWLIAPAWDAGTFKRVKEERIAILDHYKPSSIERLEFLSRSQAYRNTVYSQTASGTSLSMDAISLNDIKSFYKNNYVKSAMLLTVVSPHNMSEIERWILEPFSRIPLGLYEELKVGSLKIPEQSTFLQIRDSSDIPALSGYFLAPSAPPQDAIIAFVLAGMLDRMLRNEIIIQRGIEAEVRCNYHFMKKPGISIYIQSPEIKNVAMILKNMLNRLATEGFSDEETELYKTRLLTILYTGLQENVSLSRHIGNWTICADEATMNGLYTSISNVSASSLQLFLKTHMRKPFWVFCGLPSFLQAGDLTLEY
jgi:predicted Zn-dependent peptidase